MTRAIASLLALLSFGYLAGPSAVRAESDSYADIVARVLPSVVNISIQGAGERVKIAGEGAGAVYATYMVEYVGAGPSGIIVTNRHVINNAYEITVTLQDGSAFRAKLLGKGADNDDDLCLRLRSATAMRCVLGTTSSQSAIRWDWAAALALA